MSKKRINWFAIILILIIIAALILLFFQNVNAITGHATSQSTVSNVTIQYYLSISLCSNLSSGIWFGDVSSLPATDLNGSHNYDNTYPTLNGSTYCVNISTDGNSAVDVCIKADDHLRSPANDVIGLNNETYSNFTWTTNMTHPLLGSQSSITTSYAKSSVNVGVGNWSYYRFWLDIPVAQPSGTYNNTVSFKGVTTSSACGS